MSHQIDDQPRAGEDEDDFEEELMDNGLRSPTVHGGAESVQLYQTNHLHPVHLGKSLNDRYKVLHKLGQGGSATVWLCHDMQWDSSSPRYVAVKVLAAYASACGTDCKEFNVNFIAKLSPRRHHNLFGFPLTHFRINGPNGNHLAVVYPVFGPQTSQLVEISSTKIASSTLKAFCRQATQAMAILHARGICHGDFKPSNILTQINSLNPLSERQVMNIFGSPVVLPVVLADSCQVHHQKTAPQYIVLEARWPALRKFSKQNLRICERISLIDFGESFRMSEPNQPILGTPLQYCPPEYILDDKAGINTDIWALGCTLFEIRAGGPLFPTADDEDDEQLGEIVDVLGPLPEPWWSSTWKEREQYFHDEADADGQSIRIFTAYKRDQSLMQKLERNLYTEIHTIPKRHSKTLRHELELFADLLSKLLKYDPAQRISAADALKHPWFTLEIGY